MPRFYFITVSAGATLEDRLRNHYRGVANSKRRPEPKIGDLIKDEGFVSTSIDPEVATRFTSVQGFLFEIHLPQNGAAVSGCYIPKLVKFTDEAEMLLDRGTQFKVREIKTVNKFGMLEGPTRVIVVDAVPKN